MVETDLEENQENLILQKPVKEEVSKGSGGQVANAAEDGGK